MCLDANSVPRAEYMCLEWYGMMMSCCITLLCYVICCHVALYYGTLRHVVCILVHHVINVLD